MRDKLEGPDLLVKRFLIDLCEIPDISITTGANLIPHGLDFEVDSVKAKGEEQPVKSFEESSNRALDTLRPWSGAREGCYLI